MLEIIYQKTLEAYTEEPTKVSGSVQWFKNAPRTNIQAFIFIYRKSNIVQITLNLIMIQIACLITACYASTHNTMIDRCIDP